MKFPSKSSAEHGRDDCGRLGVGREEGVEMISGAADYDAALIGKFAEALDAVVTAHAAHADAAERERRERALDGAGIYGRSARNDLVKDAVGCGAVVAEDIKAERALACID